MKIKIIDLLNKIAKGEEVPEDIEFKGEMFGFYKGNYTYCDENNCDRWLFDDLYEILDILNNEVEILEDNTEEIEELEITSTSGNEFDKWYINDKHIANQGSSDMAFVDIANKINEVIREVNKLKESDKNE